MESVGERARRLAADEERLAAKQLAAAAVEGSRLAAAADELVRVERDGSAASEVAVLQKAEALHRRTKAAHEKAARLHLQAAALQHTPATHAEQAAPE